MFSADYPPSPTPSEADMDAMTAHVENRPYHEAFMREAINMAELALASDETPVGCVFVHDGKVIAQGMNGTNVTMNETDLYVTVEPCIMCASVLRQFRIRAVYFGCLNDRFGGCGGPPYKIYGGIYRAEAIMLLRRFYVQENEKAPEPKQKKNRELKTDIMPLVNMKNPEG
ncbi:unnamed protein product [Aureobasidium uvarum]|uniref:CMP/dCMP-type deaminase domain-containing protein n=1 Tax=Aureobasidium uvarum TaxID=2773716 RepID=A0A9N8KEI0_9PEZI|nr:unnamed protein product [Aureobasidium uvarum]